MDSFVYIVFFHLYIIKMNKVGLEEIQLRNFNIVAKEAIMDINTNIFVTFFLAALELVGKCYVAVARTFTSCKEEQLTAFESAVLEKQSARMEWYYTIAEETHGGEFVAALAVQRAIMEDLLKVFYESKLSYGTKISAEFQKYWMDICGKTIRQSREICEVAAAK